MRWRRTCRVGETRPQRWTVCAISRSATPAPPRASCRCGACCGHMLAMCGTVRGVTCSREPPGHVTPAVTCRGVCAANQILTACTQYSSALCRQICATQRLTAGVAPAVAVHEHTGGGLLMRRLQRASKHAGCTEVCSNHSMS